VRLRAHRSL